MVSLKNEIKDLRNEVKSLKSVANEGNIHEKGDGINFYNE